MNKEELEKTTSMEGWRNMLSRYVEYCKRVPIQIKTAQGFSY